MAMGSWSQVLTKMLAALASVLLYRVASQRGDATAGAPKLEIVSATKTERRMIKGDEVLEYIEIDVRFVAPVYAMSCPNNDAMHVAEAQRCCGCPANCVLSAIFSRFPHVPDLLPTLESVPTCICDVSLEEMMLKVQAWPGDQGFNVLQNRTQATIYGVPTFKEAYSTAMWKFDALMADVRCPNEANITPQLARIRRFGLNLPPIDESLLWYRAFETSFGIDEVDRLLANASRSYDERRAVFLLPMQRTKNGRTRKTGLDINELSGCRLEFPFLVGPLGEKAATLPDISKLPEKRFPCKQSAIASVSRQIRAVMEKVRTAGRQTGQCTSDWRTSFPARGEGGPGGTSVIYNSSVDAQAEQIVSEEDTRRKKRGGWLSLSEDFQQPSKEVAHKVPCSRLRWQLRLRAHNMRERAVSYTATDAVNGCWELMQRSMRFGKKTVVVESRSCKWDPDESSFYDDPCCNPQLLRSQCCRKRNNTMEKSVLMGVDQTDMAEVCRMDKTGGASFAQAAIKAALTWHRRLTEGGGIQKTWQNLAFEEQAHAAMWRVVEQCHADVMGRFDRELGVYVGSPCIVDGDCFTKCVKPSLSTLQSFVSLKANSKHRPLVLGRCTVPSGSRHRFIMECLAQRTGKEMIELFAAELNINERRRNTDEIVQTLVLNPDHMTHICVGAYGTPGLLQSEEECLSHMGCNWHVGIRSQFECELSQFKNDEFCTCAEGTCPQQSLRQGCLSGTLYDDRIYSRHCQAARDLLKPLELACALIATTAKALMRCHKLIDNHDLMMRTCLVLRCVKDVYPNKSQGVKYFYADEQCNDNARREFSNCYDQCIMPSGPNPTLNRKVCFYELWENETDRDCFQKPGDPEVHYSPPAGGEGIAENWDNALSLHVPRERRPRYCSIRIWQELQQSYKPRNLAVEEARVLYDRSAKALEARREIQRNQGAVRRQQLYDALNPREFLGCDLGPLPMTAESSGTCRSNTEYTCCLSPHNLTLAYCKYCREANTTACAAGERVLAVWAPNKRLYQSTLAEDLGTDLARVDWDDGETYYRQVPWTWLWSMRGPGCHPAKEGCASHDQCPDGQYCFSCAACTAAHGGNPPAGLCDPCPTHRAGGCGAISSCRKLLDAFDGTCPEVKQAVCPCKNEWAVRLEYPGAPTERSINGCFYQKETKQRWCEVDQKYFGQEGCDVDRIVGTTRFIFRKPCKPSTCDHCHCDCSSKCRAYDILPWEGRLPPGIIPGQLNATLEAKYLHLAGTIAPNCTQGSPARIRDQCNFCVECCADYCNATKAYQSFDCTGTEVSGCADRLLGWVDAVGRSCADYARNNLCTQGGQQGINWVYNPPRSFQDFATSGLAATNTCCDCGGGVDCSDQPYDWHDPEGNTCAVYEGKKWCNRTGYGPGWLLEWGAFPIGKADVDARTACCICGGGKGLKPPSVQNHLVEDLQTCNRVWPGRSRYEHPPWNRDPIHLCRLISNICMKKVTATAFDPGVGYAVPDDPRIYGLCMQESYDTGLTPFKEDHELSNLPGDGGRRLNYSNASAPARRLSLLDRNGQLLPTSLTTELRPEGAHVRVDFLSNDGKGLCYYRMPDPTQLFGGPNRVIMPPPLLSEAVSLTDTDVYSMPTLQALGWPTTFWGALSQAAEVNSTGQLIDLQGDHSSVSPVLRAILAEQGIEMTTEIIVNRRLDAWKMVVEAVDCKGGLNILGQREYVKFRQDLKWQPSLLHSEESCETDRCDIDDMIWDDYTCRTTYGCSVTCVFCASPALMTQEQGLCVSESPQDVKNCKKEGGIEVKGKVFDEASGVMRYKEVCAMPHRPLMYCQGEGQYIKRCSNYDEAHCEGDPLGDLMGCRLQVQRCQTKDLCELSGYCSDRGLGLNTAIPGTCVVSPLDDDLIQRGCTSDGLCYFKTDPPFGMEVRQRHGLMDLSKQNVGTTQGTPLEEAAAWANSLKEAKRASEASSMAEVAERLRAAGRLNQTECEALNPLRPPYKATWINRADSPQVCQEWKACCMLKRGDRCELFSGPIFRSTSMTSGEKEVEECALCGGEFVPIFEWTSGEWRRGSLKSPQRRWMSRKWGSINEFASVVDIDIIRQLFENALETRIGRQRVNAVSGLLEPLMTSLMTVAASCGSEAKTVDDSVWKNEAGVDGKPAPPAASQLPPTLTKTGEIIATSGLMSSGNVGDVRVSWHDYSTEKYGASDVAAVIYYVYVEPFEYSLGVAAPVIALPGRAEHVRGLLEQFASNPAIVTTTEAPADLENLNADQIEELIRVRAERAAQAASQAQREFARQTDAASDLPETSKQVLLDFGNGNETKFTANPSSANNNAMIDVSSVTCRNVVANAAGQVIGQLLGDCVQLKATKKLENAVELCVPLTFGTNQELEDLSNTEQAKILGLTFDFAEKTVVPDSYVTNMPAGPSTEVPGVLAQVIWDWDDNPQFGRLPPGWAKLTPLGLEAHLTSDGVGGNRLCAKIFYVEKTYCPIVRLKSNFRDVLWKNSSGLPKVLGFDSACPVLDQLLAPIQNMQAAMYAGPEPRVAPYQAIDQQVSNSSMLRERAQKGVQTDLRPSSQQSICLPGSCIVSTDRGFEVVTASASGGQSILEC
eukprot:TRINITY_DN23441_c0_g1_i2.p1 TRINITY_DN23441_c0_g1~~TRINITY_DN23441_c0_g1_i2.p1  ORF type:complete len:2588 (-),score=365.17 TRINITY_DN23441_c0_g1_i2:2-7765(-)